MRIVVSNPLSEGRREQFNFEGERLNTPEFVETFKRDYSMQKNYDHLRRAFSIPFGETILEGEFTIYDGTLLTPEFMQAFKFGMHNRWDSTLGEAYDPALNPSMSGCLVSREDLKKIETTLAAIFELFGENGLRLAREFNLAQSIIDICHYIKVDDPEDIYDLPVIRNTTKKELVLDYEDFDPIARCIDAFTSSLFSFYPNENIKSALFAVPQLLYADGKFISPSELHILLTEIESSLSSTEVKLDNKTYKEALDICLDIYVRNNKESFPRKGNVKQYPQE